MVLLEVSFYRGLERGCEEPHRCSRVVLLIDIALAVSEKHQTHLLIAVDTATSCALTTPKGERACQSVKKEEVAAALECCDRNLLRTVWRRVATFGRGSGIHLYGLDLPCQSIKMSSMHCVVVYEQKRCMMRSAWAAFKTKRGI